jgi:hypothetical protein
MQKALAAVVADYGGLSTGPTESRVMNDAVGLYDLEWIKTELGKGPGSSMYSLAAATAQKSGIDPATLTPKAEAKKEKVQPSPSHRLENILRSSSAKMRKMKLCKGSNH